MKGAWQVVNSWQDEDLPLEAGLPSVRWPPMPVNGISLGPRTDRARCLPSATFGVNSGSGVDTDFRHALPALIQQHDTARRPPRRKSQCTGRSAIVGLLDDVVN